MCGSGMQRGMGVREGVILMVSVILVVVSGFQFGQITLRMVDSEAVFVYLRGVLLTV